MERLNAVISIIALLIGMTNLLRKGKNWDISKGKAKLDSGQVANNLRHHRRFDYGTGYEENWKHTWNNRHPEYHGIKDFITLFLESVFYMIASWLIMALICIGVIINLDIVI